MFYAETGSYPQAVTDLDSLGVKVAAGSYATHVNGLMYCLSPDRTTFCYCARKQVRNERVLLHKRRGP